MGSPFAEVIGDPIAQSKSPIIHRHWLKQLGIDADYRKTRVPPDQLATFVSGRQADPNWSGCNVTTPHKISVIPLLNEVARSAALVGAVNCVERKVASLSGKLVGHNTDIDGVAAALDSTDLQSRKAVVIGAGGGARAVIAYLSCRGIGRIAVVARDPRRAEAVLPLAPNVDTRIADFDHADTAFSGAAAIINASSLGMAGAEPMPQPLVAAVLRHAAGATIFDLVTTPAETRFLAAGRSAGGLPVDGLTMLVGQAARAFELFFGAPAPAPDEELRDLLIAKELK